MADPIEIAKKSFRRKSNNDDKSVLDYGKIPPQSRNLEEAVLAALLIEKSAVENIMPYLIPDMFYYDNHQRICIALLQLIKDKTPIDLISVVEQLKANGDLENVGGAFYIAQLSNKIGSAAHAESHVRMLFEKYIQRKLISTSTEIIKDAYDDTVDVFDIFEKAEKGISDLSKLFYTGSVSSLVNVIEESEKQTSSGFVASKHKFINKAFAGGWQKGTLNIIAARPGMGKSAFHVSELLNCVGNDSKCASFNLEMMQRQLITRFVCNLTAIPNTRYNRNNLFAGEDEKIAQAKRWILSHEHNLTLDFTAGITVYELIAKMKKIKADKGLEIAFIDHLQFIRLPASETKGKSKDEQIGIITSALKAFAKAEEVALIVFCHLSRETEKSNSKRPGLSHLRESGNIENDADTVSFLFRPEYYFEKDENGIPQYKNADERAYQNICQFLNDKNRDGHVFESEMKCYLGNSNFIDVPKDEESAQQEKAAIVTGYVSADDDLPF